MKYFIVTFVLVLTTIPNLNAQKKNEKTIRFETSKATQTLGSNEWVERDDKTVSYQMFFSGGSSCMPKPENLKVEVKNNVFIVKDFQSEVCTRDIVERYIDIIIDKNIYPNYKSMKVVYLRNANELECDFTVQQIVKSKPKIKTSKLEKENLKNSQEVPPNGTFIFTVKDFEASKTGKWKVVIKGNKATIYSLGQEIWDTTAKKKKDLIGKTNIIKYKGKWISVKDNELDKDFEVINGGQFETWDFKNKTIYSY